MKQIYRYRGFDIVVNALRGTDSVAHVSDPTARRAYAASVTLKTRLIGGEWSTAFRVGPVPVGSSTDLSEVLAAGFAAATRVVDDVVSVMGEGVARKAA
ncbi:hypothetical protein BJG93_24700 [Paraburkholderia sprentiae WSM5005]|uniref:ABC-type transport auxiliary lipoprotein component domain-containing protein n=1 Tax=Paraburkholderia sprentiae WSM5005 TaxID=754502 RepID=A0A1I9YST9_9BURK|nr:hypothetical protein [Paraburkholderia sprentiae]APA89293.1 hypothetical protein BJG93_24700 [Paraburkholderia sprentiae WSM5005]